MYSYQKVEGEVLSKNPTLYNFSKLLDWLNEFWEKKNYLKITYLIFTDLLVILQGQNL